MALEYSELLQVERRRKITISVLGASLFVSTIPIVNERALFGSLAESKPESELTPQAYAIFFPGRGGIGQYRVAIRGGTEPSEMSRSEGSRRAEKFHLTKVSLFDSEERIPALFTMPEEVQRAIGGGELSGTNPIWRAGGDSIGGMITVTPGNGGGGGGGGEIIPIPAAAVPEPATWLMMIIGIGAIALMLRRGSRSSARYAD